MATHLLAQLLRPGDWAVIANGDRLHLAELVGGLPRGRALCGAVGTAFIVSTSPGRTARICDRCIELRHEPDPDRPG